jgi:hypothetical protein
VCGRHRFFFEFDKAFTDQLIRKFEASPAHPLSEDAAPPEKGVYALYRHRKIVYAGKALDTTLRRRLGEHTRKIAGRRNIELSEMRCRFLIIDSDWFVRAGEHALIESYEPEWNLSGFGSHVPGRGRPGIKRSRWDTDFPPK